MRTAINCGNIIPAKRDWALGSGLSAVWSADKVRMKRESGPAQAAPSAPDCRICGPSAHSFLLALVVNRYWGRRLLICGQQRATTANSKQKTENGKQNTECVQQNGEGCAITVWWQGLLKGEGVVGRGKAEG